MPRVHLDVSLDGEAILEFLDSLDIAALLLDAGGETRAMNEAQRELLTVPTPGRPASPGNDGDPTMLPTRSTSERRVLRMTDHAGALTALLVATPTARSSPFRLRELQRANDRLDAYATTVAHDLRTPLAEVLTHLDLVAEHDLPPAARDHLEQAVDGGAHLLAVLEALLATSRAEATIARDPVDLADAAQRALASLRTQVEESGATIVIGDLPTVPGDASLLQQVFMNLLANSLKFVGAEPPAIHISAERDGSAWRIAVRDRGIGPPVQTEEAFTPFARPHGTAFPGSGIGLSMCRAVVERHGGRIEMGANDPCGTMVVVTLPA